MLRGHPRLVLSAVVLAIGVAAVPVIAFGVVPLFVRSTLVEALPTAAPLSSASASAAPGAGASVAFASSAPALQTLLKGDLVKISAADYGSGVVSVVRIGADRFLRFENVDIAGAPDMYVYLSNATDGKPGTFTDLGKLKATNGSFNYPIPASVDLAGVRSVVVWCRQFTVTVTYAVLR